MIGLGFDFALCVDSGLVGVDSVFVLMCLVYLSSS